MQNFYLPIILLLITSFAFLSSYKLYLSVLKSILDTLIVFILIFSLFLICRKQNLLILFNKSIIKLVIGFSILISFVLIIHFFDIYSLPSYRIANNLITNSINIDFNFALIPIFFGFISILFFLSKKRSIRIIILSNIVISIQYICIVTSGSRRGLFLFGLILLLLFLSLFKRKNGFFIVKNLKLFFLFLTISMITIIAFFSIKDFEFKVKTLHLLGIKDIRKIRMSANLIVLKNARTSNKDISYKEIDTLLWKPYFSSKYPFSGWGYKSRSNDVELSNISAKNDINIPNGAKGYLLDKNSEFDVKNGNAYSSTKIAHFNFENKNQIKSSVYCFVSEDFNGDIVRIGIKGSATGNIFKGYNLSNKGCWQKLVNKAFCQEGEAFINLTVAKTGVSNFSSLKGHVIFAYPEFQKTNKEYSFDSFNPESGWGNKPHKTEFPLKGKNVEIVPANSIGYLLDSASYQFQFNENKNTSYTTLFNIEAKESAVYDCSVYCFVSHDFIGKGPTLSLAASSVTNQQIEKIIRSKYNMRKKGTWQKLNIQFGCVSKGKLPVIAYVSKLRQNLSDGHVIFAFPEYKHTNQRKKKKKIRKSNFVNKEIAINMAEHFVDSSSLKFKDPDPIRFWISNITNEDTTYQPLKNSLDIEGGFNIAVDRVNRWKFAWEIFTKEYSWMEKIFGGGFSFLNWYGYIYQKDKTKTDYPHNPFLHILLYSGIVGLLLYITLLYMVFKLYIKYRKEYSVMFIFFSVIYYFTFFSGGIPFEPPMLGFFIMLPFFIHSIRKTEDKKKLVTPPINN